MELGIVQSPDVGEGRPCTVEGSAGRLGYVISNLHDFDELGRDVNGRYSGSPIDARNRATKPPFRENGFEALHFSEDVAYHLLQIVEVIATRGNADERTHRRPSTPHKDLFATYSRVALGRRLATHGLLPADVLSRTTSASSRPFRAAKVAERDEMVAPLMASISLSSVIGSFERFPTNCFRKRFS